LFYFFAAHNVLQSSSTFLGLVHLQISEKV
jgi:hypothetical protein